MHIEDFVLQAALGHKGSWGSLEALFLIIVNKVFLMLDGLNNSMRGKGEVFIRLLNHGLQLRVVLTKGIDQEDGMQVVIIKQADGKDPSIEWVNFLNNMSHYSARV